MINNEPCTPTRWPCKELPGVYFRNQQEQLQNERDKHQQRQNQIKAIKAFEEANTPIPTEVLYAKGIPYLLADQKSEILDRQGLSELKEQTRLAGRGTESSLTEIADRQRPYLEVIRNNPFVR